MALAAELELGNAELEGLAKANGLHPHIVGRKPDAPTIAGQCQSLSGSLQVHHEEVCSPRFLRVN